MNHLAVDLGSKQSQVCERSPQGDVLREARLKNSLLKAFFAQQPKSQVVLESCAEAFTVASWAKEAGHEVVVVPSTLAPALGVGARGVKTDKRDAQNLSLASCRMAQLPAVHQPGVVAKSIRSELASRALLVRMRTMAINHVRGYLRQALLRPKSGATRSFLKRVRELLLAQEEGIPQHLELVLGQVELLNQQLAAADRALMEIAKNDAVCQRLMTVPGVGPVTAAVFRATVDDVSRFANAQLLRSYLGLTPKEDSSGERQHRGGISKAGNSMARWALIQAAWAAWRTAPGEPMVRWAKELAMRKPKGVAIVALARKLAGILYAVWRDDSVYSSQHS